MADGAASVADVLALTRNGDGMFGGNGNGFVILILFILMATGGFGGFGGFGGNGALTRAEMSQGFADNQILNKLDGISQGICSSTYDLANKFSEQTLFMNNGFNSVNSNLNQIAAQMASCCCDIKTAVHTEGEATRAMIQANVIQGLRDKLAEQGNELQAAQLVIQNTNQTQTILDRLGSYYTNPPYNGCCYG